MSPAEAKETPRPGGEAETLRAGRCALRPGASRQAVAHARLVVLWFLVSSALLHCAEGPLGPRGRVGRTRDHSLRPGIRAQRRADTLRVAYEAKYGRRDAMPAGEDEAAVKVVAAYQDAMGKAAGSRLAAYCGLRLSGFYKFRGQHENAIAEAVRVARSFRGTVYEAKAYLTVGLLHLQARHDPAAATLWFKKLAPPAGADDEGAVPKARYNEGHKLYITAQMQLAKCEAMLGDCEAAKSRHQQMARGYPHAGPRLLEQGRVNLGEAEAWRSRPSRGTQQRFDPRHLVIPDLREHVPLCVLLDEGKTKEEASDPPPVGSGLAEDPSPEGDQAAQSDAQATAADVPPPTESGGPWPSLLWVCSGALAGLSAVVLALLSRLRTRKEKMS